MSRNPEYEFVPTDPSQLEKQMTASYEKLVGEKVQPASHEKLLIQWVASVILQERVWNNYTGNQNIPSRAEGDNLDALGQLFYNVQRPQAKAAFCTMRFFLSAPQNTAILIPSGTRVTDSQKSLVWATKKDTYIPIGEISTDIPVHCQTFGKAGNGYQKGQINVLIDLFDFYDHCENITASDGGANRASDAEYYELIRASTDGYGSAGAAGGYIFFAKKVSTEIADVVANSPAPSCTSLYVLMKDGSIASEEIKQAVRAACNGGTVRPLTDFLSVDDPEIVPYDIQFTYFLPEESDRPYADIQADVVKAVEQYKTWQCTKLGRDINPSYLIWLLMKAGIKRVELTKPVFQTLLDGTNGEVPQVAAIRNVNIINGGRELE